MVEMETVSEYLNGLVNERIKTGDLEVHELRFNQISDLEGELHVEPLKGSELILDGCANYHLKANGQQYTISIDTGEPPKNIKLFLIQQISLESKKIEEFEYGGDYGWHSGWITLNGKNTDGTVNITEIPTEIPEEEKVIFGQSREIDDFLKKLCKGLEENCSAKKIYPMS